jgi:hypothetical protein
MPSSNSRHHASSVCPFQILFASTPLSWQVSGMTTNFQQLLKEQSINPDIAEKGEGPYDGARFYGRIDQVLGLTVEALLKDGIDREGVMMLFASNAVKALYKGVKLTEARKRKNEVLLQSAAITLPKKYGG